MKRLLLMLSLGAALSVRAQPVPLDSAVTLFEEGKTAEAKGEFEKIVATEPQNARALYFLGRVAMRENRLEEGVELLAKAAAIAPANAEYQSRYGSACMTVADKKRSLAYARRGKAALEKALELNPDDIPAREDLLEYYAQVPGIVGGSMTKAYEHAAEIARRNPERGFVMTISLKNTEKKFDEIFALCSARLEQTPDDYPANYEYGRAAALSGKNLERGIATLKKCLTLEAPINFPPHSGAWYRLGQIYEKQKDVAAARNSYEEALKLSPDTASIKEALAKLPSR